MSCLFTDRPEYSHSTLFDFENNGNNNGLPFFYKVVTACQLVPHRHTYLQIVYLRRGELTHVCQSHITDLRCGDILLLPPYVPHYFIPIEGHSFDLIEFEFNASFVDSALTEGVPYDTCDALSWLEPYCSGHSYPLVSLSGESRFTIDNAFAEIEKEYNGQDDCFTAMIRAQTIRILTCICRLIHSQSEHENSEILYDRHRDALLKSLDFIRSNYTRDISIQDAAQVAIMSSSYYRHYFKVMTHKTFTEYLNGLRVTHAISLIRNNPHMKIVDICYLSGFSNISHFNRTFLKVTGVTPKVFRHSTIQECNNDRSVI